MSDLRTAAQQALEALESYRNMMFVEAGCRFKEGEAAITALHTALALPEVPKGGGNLPPPLQAEPVQDQDDILRMAREAGIIWWSSDQTFLLTRFFSLAAAAEREKLAHWMRSMGYATGHGDTIEDLLDHLGTQIAEGLEAEVLMEREACAKECDAVSASADKAAVDGQYLVIRNGAEARRCAAAIRARSKT
jgi:hypothetical protein